MDIYLELGSSYKKEVNSLEPNYYVGKSYKGLTTNIMLNTRSKSNKKKNTGTVNTEYAYQDITNITYEFKKHPFSEL